MRKLYFFYFLALSSIAINAQEKRTLIQGKVTLDSLFINNVHIINKNTNIGTITNEYGVFEIPVKLGDSLFVSHLNYNDTIIFISDKILKNENFNIKLVEKTYTLEEITIEKKQSIFYVDKEIMPDNGVVVNAETLHLPYANTTAKKDEAVLKIRSGGVVNLDNLINKINGNQKREKLAKKLKSEDTELTKIRKYFTDDFFITDLKIEKDYINQFLSSCLNKNILYVFKHKNKLQLLKLLIQESALFPRKIIDENGLLSKK
ncbi:carboxypeptidase-like regulatory domain-containing protein [Polaribacter sp.]|uniref:carboxypeptidase-like regulatory domain-containing protein n=1 Tax=Polaribacter sp. TaxID=1920175 RepID=UPI003EFAFCBD